MEKVLHSKINEIMKSDDMRWELIELQRSAMKHGKKANAFYKILNKYGVKFEQLGIGTNRVGIKINGFCYKYSLNKEGCFDTRREMYLSKNLGRDVVMVHEISSDGIIGVYEYVRTLSNEAELQQYYDKIHEALTRITTKFFVGDMGIVTKNSRNWGVRSDGSVCSIDFAYIRTTRSADVVCPMCKSMYRYAPDFGSVSCNCRRNVKFEEIRRYFTDDTPDLAHIPHNTYEFNGEDRKLVVLDSNKSIIEISQASAAEERRKKILARKLEDAYVAPDMLKRYKYVMNDNKLGGNR